jgi:YD repeat-containing protein
LSWGASTDAVGVTGYLISRCSGAGCTSFTQIASVSGTTLSYSNTGLSSATSYSYEVRATDAAGLYSGYSPIGSATTPTGSGVSGSVSYGYDALGRLIQVASPTLSSVEELSYDAAGNISSNASNVMTALKVANLSVDQAAAGERITIDGSGFSATASADTVTINGVAA